MLLLWILSLFHPYVSYTSNTTSYPLNLTTYDATTPVPTPAPTIKCVEIEIEDDDYDNYITYPLNGGKHMISLFMHWTFRLASHNSYIYHDSDGIFANLFYLDQSGWIMEVFDPYKNVSNRKIYQSFITDDQLPITQSNTWKQHGGSELKLTITCHETYSSIIYTNMPNTTAQYIPNEDNTKSVIDEHTLLLIFALIIILLVCILLIIVCGICCFMRKYGRDRCNRHEHIEMSDGMELQTIRKETSDNALNGYNAVPNTVPLAQPNERNSVRDVIVANPGMARGVSIRVSSPEELYDPADAPDGGSGSSERIVGFNPYETVDVYRDLDDSEQSMERATFIE